MGALMVMEVSKKQHYIFKSRKLKDQIGASSIIKYITEELFYEPYCDINHFAGSLIFKGGGKSLFEFEDLKKAKEFISEYSKIILKEFQGVELFMSCIEYNPIQDKIVDSIGTLFERLAQKKGERMNAFCQVDFGVNLMCRESKLPANYIEYKGRKSISNETAKKIEFALKINNNKKNKSLNFFQELLPDNSYYKDDFDNQDSDSKNMIAIIHIDGNNMGQRVLAIRNEYKEISPSENKEYINALNDFSKGVDNAYKKAFMRMLISVKTFVQNKKEAEGDTPLPIRPLILAGDDICYICKGNIGIESARIFLEELYRQKDKSGRPYTGCAGIAIVKTKYPFFKAYELSEDLCSEAKKALAQEQLDASAIDWHLNLGELSNTISDIRSKDYKTDENHEIKLYRRPYLLDGTFSVTNSKKYFSYVDFKDSKKIVERIEENSRGVLKSFRNAIKTGPDATKEYFKIHKNLTEKMHEDEFQYNSSRSFDAIEIMDVYESLEV